MNCRAFVYTQKRTDYLSVDYTDCSKDYFSITGNTLLSYFGSLVPTTLFLFNSNTFANLTKILLLNNEILFDANFVSFSTFTLSKGYVRLSVKTRTKFKILVN